MILKQVITTENGIHEWYIEGKNFYIEPNKDDFTSVFVKVDENVGLYNLDLSNSEIFILNDNGKTIDRVMR